MHKFQEGDSQMDALYSLGDAKPGWWDAAGRVCRDCPTVSGHGGWLGYGESCTIWSFWPRMPRAGGLFEAYRDLSKLSSIAAAFPGWFRRIVYLIQQCTMLIRQSYSLSR